MSYLKMDLKNKDKKYYLGIIGINIGIMMIIFIFILNEKKGSSKDTFSKVSGYKYHLINSSNVIHLINLSKIFI